MQPPTSYSREVNPRIPKRLERLEELANNLWYGWNRPTRSLFARLNPALWDAVGHTPKAMLKRIDEQRLIDAAADPAFLDSLSRVLAAFDAYHAEPPFKQNAGGFRPEDLVAYFCAEFGMHESLPMYSGGLGILAGDHCKAASDFQLPFIAVGLLYRRPSTPTGASARNTTTTTLMTCPSRRCAAPTARKSRSSCSFPAGS